MLKLGLSVRVEMEVATCAGRSHGMWNGSGWLLLAGPLAAVDVNIDNEIEWIVHSFSAVRS